MSKLQKQKKEDKTAQRGGIWINRPGAMKKLTEKEKQVNGSLTISAWLTKKLGLQIVYEGPVTPEHINAVGRKAIWLTVLLGLIVVAVILLI